MSNMTTAEATAWHTVSVNIHMVSMNIWPE